MLTDEDKMVDNEFTRALLGRPNTQNNMLKEAARRADILKNMQGCSKCRARLENPHADYHLTALIDDSKI